MKVTESAPPMHVGDEDTATAARHARYGLVLFAIYVLLYGGFMGLSAFAPGVMAMKTPIGGMNLALVYGLGLIVMALVLALIYMVLCRPRT